MDHSLATHVEETQASALATPEHLGVARVHCKIGQRCSWRDLEHVKSKKGRESNSKQKNNHTTHIHVIVKPKSHLSFDDSLDTHVDKTSKRLHTSQPLRRCALAT